MKTVIEVDEYKKLVPGYDPLDSETYHKDSAKLADKDFERQIKLNQFDKIIFMAGGVASGKTEFVDSFYKDSENILIYDGTMKNIAGFEIKYKKIKKYQKGASVEVVYIIPNSIEQAYKIFLKRDRKMKTATFVDTHIKSKLSFASIGKLFPDANLAVYLNDLTGGSGSYQRWVTSRKNLINAIKSEGIYLKLNLQNIINTLE